MFVVVVVVGVRVRVMEGVVEEAFRRGWEAAGGWIGILLLRRDSWAARRM